MKQIDPKAFDIIMLTLCEQVAESACQGRDSCHTR